MTKNSRPSRRRGGKTRAERADRHVLYQLAVQSPEFEIELFEERYKALRGRKPRSLREDFCGTALLSVEWCKSHPKRSALGVDLCRDTLDWGRRHNLKPAGPDVAARVDLRHGNVLDVHDPKVDLTCAMNFSYCVFKTRGALRHYFESVRRGLKEDGVFVLDLLGGTETMDVMEEEREVEEQDFTYVWDQAKFNPITHDFLCHIHFAFPDGSRLKRAFTYDWRLWTLPELREVLMEAGFARVHVFWERFEEDPEGGEDLVGTGDYYETLAADNQEAWVAYIVAEA
jgi:SAM-dependent methyltransferase